MNKHKFNPFYINFDELGKTVDNFINKVHLDDFFGSDCVKSAPSINAFEYEGYLEILVAAPGMQKEDFNIDIQDNELSISSNKEKKKYPENTKVRHKEFDFSSFKRVFKLNSKYNFNTVKASYTNGILSILITKKEQEANRKIKVEIN
jgi:HSP20 family protein